MFCRKIRCLTLVCVFAMAAISMTAVCEAGCFSCMTPAYAPVAVAPACTTCAPYSVQYMPSTVYRALYQPAVVTAYQPVVGCSTCPTYGYAAAYTTYRPAFAWSYPARLVPYTTYRPYYVATPVVSYMGCSTCSPCGVSCGTCSSGCDSCSSPCVSGSCGATYSYESAPATGCASCAASQAPTLNNAPAPANNSAPPQTFEQKVEKPATEPELKPIPQTDTQPSSMSAPALHDPRDRTATRTNYSPIPVTLTALPTQDDGWRPARD